MCDYPPTTTDAVENYRFDNVSSNVGQTVTVYCKNATVAIVKCLPNLRWNATVPSCDVGETSSDNMGTLLIIVWVVGGVLLLSLIILIMAIITSKSKTGCALGGNSSPSTSIFHISSNGLRRGGDNPAFTRADELCGEWSYHRADNFPESQRLPSYQEAILNRYITVPARTGDANHQQPATVISTTDSPSYQHNQLQRSEANAGSSNITVAASQSRSERSDTRANQIIDTNTITNQIIGTNTSTNQIIGTDTRTNQIIDTDTRTNQIVERDIGINQTAEMLSSRFSQRHELSESFHNAIVDPRESCDQIDSSTHQRSCQSDTAASTRRFAEDYPQCFFDEDPPPPYTTGPANYPLHRTAHLNQQREHHPNRRRSMHAVNCAELNPGQIQDNVLHNPHFRRSMCDRLISVAVSASHASSERQQSCSRTTDGQTSNIAAVCSSQNDTIYDTRINNGAIYHSDISANCTETRNPTPRYSAPNGSFSNAVHPVPNSVSNAIHDVPMYLSVSNNGRYPAQQSYVSTITVDGNRNKDYTDYNNEPINQGTLYVVRNSQATPTAPPDLSIIPYSYSHHRETQPIGTSTPVNQSPAEIRRFVPVNHPSPLPIPHNQLVQNSKQNHLTCHNTQREPKSNHSTYNYQERPSMPHHLPKDNQHFKQTGPGCAPLARFDGDQSYL